MKRLRWRRIVALIIILILLIIGIKCVYTTFIYNGAKNVTGDGVPEGPALSLPQVPLTPSNMTPEQKQSVIEQMIKDAKAAALASGQSEDQAEAFAKKAGQAASEAMQRPSTVDGDQ